MSLKMTMKSKDKACPIFRDTARTAEQGNSCYLERIAEPAECLTVNLGVGNVYRT